VTNLKTCDAMPRLVQDNLYDDETSMVIQAFEIIDYDNTGLISAEKIRHFMINVAKVEEKKVDDLLRAYKSGRSDGFIDYKDFVRYMNMKFANSGV